MIDRDDFIRRIAAAIFKGQRRRITEADALERARQVADKLPGLFNSLTIPLGHS